MFETKSAKEVLQDLNTNVEQGLSSQEAGERLIKYGPNKLPEKKKTPLFLVFLGQFNDPMIFILLAAALLSIAISIFNTVKNGESFDFADPVIIMGVCVLNAIIGTVQENKAEKSLEALKKMSSPTCVVRRDGKLIELKAEELVPGDIVILEEGRTVPADLRLISAINLKTDESSLTGESLPVEKDADIVFTDSSLFFLIYLQEIFNIEVHHLFIFRDIISYLDQYAASEEAVAVNKSIELNNIRWDDDYEGVNENIDNAKDWFIRREVWMNDTINGKSTGIMNIETEGADKTYYNLQGQRVASPRHGLYIKDGKKIILK